MRHYMHTRKLIELELGKHYVVFWNYRNKQVCKFIQPTKCGFNFLNLDTDKCILKNHLYRSKYERHMGGNWFFVNGNLKIE